MRKLLILFFLAACLQIPFQSKGQGISLEVQDMPLESIFNLVQRQSAYRFIYTSEQLTDARKVSVSVVNAPITKVLDVIFRDQPVGYNLKGQIVMITTKKNVVITGHTAGIDVTGKVVNEQGDGLPAVTLLLKGNGSATATDDKGNFVLKNVPVSSILVISSIGYESKQVVFQGQTNLITQLVKSMNTLDETVVKGYYTTSKRLNTGSVSKLTSEEIGQQPVSNVLGAMEGRMPGVYIQQKGGLPGSNAYVEIRGRGSIGSATDPLYIIDGVPFSSRAINSPLISTSIFLEGISPLSNINPSDIESIEVLKDADATAIYGSRGANGVVLITTKKGKSGKTGIEANVYAGTGRISHRMDLLNTQQYVAMRKEAFRNDAVIPTASNAKDLLVWDTTKYTDWQKKMIGGTAKFLESRIAVSGGNDQTQFLIAGDFRKETTVFPGDNSTTRGSGMFNLSHHSGDSRFRVELSAIYLANTNHLPNVDLTASALFLAPNTPDLVDPTGNLVWPAGVTNPFSYLKTRYSSGTTNFITNAVISYRLMPGLSLKTSLGYTQMLMSEVSVNPLSSFNPAYGYTSANTYSDFGNNGIKTWIAEPQINYSRRIGKGVLDLIGGLTFQQNTRNGQTLNGTGYSSDALMENIGSATTVSVTNTIYSQYKYNAFFGRVAYNLSDKYILNLTGRRDGSSRFGPGKQFGNFGAVGLGWIFSKEKFMVNHLPFVSFGKIRASIGTTGNDQIDDYQFMDLWQSTNYSYNGSGGLSPTRIVNPDYSWERTNKIDVGIETGFLKDRIRLVVDYYQSRTNNQLVGMSLPPSTGAQYVQANFEAIVQNKGWEMEISSINIKQPHFLWSTSFNLTLPKNKLLRYPGIENTFYATQYTVGKPLTIVKAYHYTGVDRATGVFKFEDANKDGMLSYPEDIQSIKDISQTYYGGLANRIVYHAFELNVFIQFVKQTGVIYLGAFKTPGFLSNQPVAVLNRWQHPGEETNIQKFTQARRDAYQGYINSVYYGDNRIGNASYARLKNISLAFNAPGKWLEKIRFQQLKIYLQAQNLFTKTSYLGMDPENQNAYSLPSLKMFVAGIQFTL